MALIPQFFTASTKTIVSKAYEQGILSYPSICFIEKDNNIAWITKNNDLIYLNNTLSFDDLTEEQLASLKGETGSAGNDGVSPVIEIIETETGATLKVTDINGTQETTINNGKDGADGISPIVKLVESDSNLIITVTDKEGVKSATLNGFDINLSDYALKSDIPTNYLTSIPDDYVTNAEMTEAISNALGGDVVVDTRKLVGISAKKAKQHMT